MNKKPIPYFLFLLPLYFLAWGHTAWHPYTSFNYVFIRIILILLCELIICFLLLKKVGNLFASLFTFYLTGVYLFFGNTKDTFISIPLLYSYKFLIPAIVVFPFLIYHLIKKHTLLQKKLFHFCNLLMAVLIIIQIILFFSKKEPAKKKSDISFNIQDINHKTSIHLIVCDGYPGYRSLNEHFNFDNTDFINFLKEKNYFVADSVSSNYFQTYSSVNSILNLQYIPYLSSSTIQNYRTVLQQLNDINNNYLIQYLKSIGYNIYNNSIFKLNDMEVTNGNAKFISADELFFQNLLHNRITKDFLWMFATGKWKIKKVYEKTSLRQYHHAQQQIDICLKNNFQKPYFTYTHLLMPHEPYFTNRNGRLISKQEAKGLSEETMFVEYLQYTNAVLKKIINNIYKKDSNTIVILMSDHGYRDYKPEENQQLKFNNFLAVYFPDKKYENIKKMHSNVNLFRIVLDQFFLQKFSLLPDSTIYIDEQMNTVQSQALD